MLERYGVKLWDYSTVFWGKGDDGNWYGGVAAISFHGTGQPVSPAIFNIYSSAEPQNPNRLFFNCIPQMTKTSDSISYSAIDGEKSLTYTVKKVDGATLVSVDAKGPGIDVHVELTPQMTYWYGQNTGVDMIFPDSPSAGFEEPSESVANITIRGQKANMKNGAGNSECWYNSAISNMKEKFVDWRTNLAKYGNVYPNGVVSARMTKPRWGWKSMREIIPGIATLSQPRAMERNPVGIRTVNPWKV